MKIIVSQFHRQRCLCPGLMGGKREVEERLRGEVEERWGEEMGRGYGEVRKKENKE